MNQVMIECDTVDAARALRDALRQLEGIDVEDELMAKAGGFDARKLVIYTAATISLLTIPAVAIVATLSVLGFTSISINGKLVNLVIGSVEGAIKAEKPSPDNNK